MHLIAVLWICSDAEALREIFGYVHSGVARQYKKKGEGVYASQPRRGARARACKGCCSGACAHGAAGGGGVAVPRRTLGVGWRLVKRGVQFW